jgi:hypothetical protein
MNRALTVFILMVITPLADAQSLVPEAEQYHIRVEFRRWQVGLDSEIQMTSGDNPTGTLINVRDDLGVSDHGTFEVRGILQLGLGKKLRFGFTPLDYDGDKRVERSLRFEGTVYNLNTRVVTSVKGNWYTGEFEWDIFHGEKGYLGLLIGVKAFDGTTVLVAPELGIREVEGIQVPAPVLGLTSRIYAGHVSVSAEVSGLSIGDRGNLYELDLGAHVDVVNHLGVGVGFRLLSMHGKNDRDLIDFKLSGVYLGADVNF